MRAFFTTLTAALSLAACTGDALEPGSPDSAGPAFAAATIPLAGRCQTSFQFTGPTSLQIASDCVIRGIGRVSGLSEQHLEFTDDGMLITNTTTYTTANGDQLFASFSGVGIASGPTVTFSGTETFAGGTGRFGNAAGSATLEGSASLISQTGEYTTTGTLSW